jgi:dephospho-CoA kinase
VSCETVQRHDHCLLLGVTGGIASGKSTVANMLGALGAPIVDTDIIARAVVEPGKPAWKEIVAYFGEQVLQKDGFLDRKKLSDIVFRDPERRKALEGFTHPRIRKAVAGKIREIAGNDPDAIIQVVIPLLIESGQRHRYHKTLLVYIPREMQIERLVKRDGINREEAIMRLEAQMPIDEKVAHADFVIHNEHSLEETRKQVEDLWRILKRLQKDMAHRVR